MTDPDERPAAPGLATAALVCGIAGLFVFFVGVISIAAVAIGLVAASRISRGSGTDVGLGRARMGVILGLIGTAGFMVVVVATVVDLGGTDDPTRLSRFRIGDCVDLAEPEADVATVTGELPARDCAEPHDGEVFAVGALPEDSAYPGRSAVTSTVFEICTGGAFEAYVGERYGPSQLDAYFLSPTAEAWRSGERGYVCVAVTVNGDELVGTVEGSER